MTTAQIKAHGMSVDQTWETPGFVFDLLDREFHFTLDPCCSPRTAKVKTKFYTEADNGLAQDWSKDIVFMNPPYGRALPHWIRKAYEESRKGATVVCLITARPDSKYWHEYCFQHGTVAFPQGRIPFEKNGKRYEGTPPFAAAFVVFAPADKQDAMVLKLTKFGKSYLDKMGKRVHILRAI